MIFRGFTIVELLVVIAVIALIATIAIGRYSKLTDNADLVRVQRNAQSIAWTAAAAQAGGNKTIENAPDLDAAVELLFRTVEGNGALTGVNFSISKIEAAEVTKAKEYLSFSRGRILYEPEP